jgi:hypothetical protein
LQKPATPDVASDDGQYAVLGNFLKRVAGSVLIVSPVPTAPGRIAHATPHVRVE